MIKYWLFLILSFISFQVFYAQKEVEKSLKLMFIGDIMGHGPQLKSAFNPITKTYNYDSNFQYIQTILSNADFTIGNLEVTLGTKPYSGYPQFSSPAELAEAVKNAGIDVLGTANNHSCDRRKKGLIKTVEILDSLNITHFGTYVSASAKESLNPLLVEKNGIRIALLNYTYGTNGIPIPAGTVVNLLDKKAIQKDIETAKALKPDQIIAFVHWGQQYKDLPSSSQKNWFAYFQSLGVNIVIGSHPHVVQPMEWDKNKNTLAVYSLGNFISNQRTFPRDGGAIFELELKKEKNQISISKAEYQLIWVLKEKLIAPQFGYPHTDYTILPIDEFEYKSYFFRNQADYKKMIRYANHARTLFNTRNMNIDENKPFTKGMIDIMQDLYLRF